MPVSCAAILLSAASGAGLAVFVLHWRRKTREVKPKKSASLGFKPVSVNWHFTRVCNYGCHFCFHTTTEQHLMKMQDAKRGLALLKGSGMQKLNFSGGEPFLFKRFLGELVRHCKEELCLESVSIVSNGSLIDEQWMQKFGSYLDILAVSCDSFDPDVLRSLGRCTSTGDTDHIGQTKKVQEWCEKYNIAFKINTVVTAKNVHEDMSDHIKLLNPKRWKVFQVLPIEGENVGKNRTFRNACNLEITQEAFDEYIRRHRADVTVGKVIVPEDNAHMRDSYLILDQRMRFLDCTSGKKIPSVSILDAGGVEAALVQAGHDVAMFQDRGGVYEWRKADMLDTQDIEEVAKVEQ
jgi:radical S-adenosyl methionine domain-containing protein 2